VHEIKTTEERDKERFPALKRELDELRGRMQDIDDMMQQADQKISDVDDELATKHAETRSLSSKLNNLTVELTRQQAEQKTVKTDLRESRRQVGALQRLLASSAERPHTPRVD
jgi:chromosome segregation ATPase